MLLAKQPLYQLSYTPTVEKSLVADESEFLRALMAIALASLLTLNEVIF